MSPSTLDRGAQPLILAYHAVSSSWDEPLAISEAALHAQLGHISDRGYVGLTFSDAERRRREGTLPPRSVVVTFDDGYASTLRAAAVLSELGLPGTVFVVTRFVDSGEPLSWAGISDLLRPETADELSPLSWEQAELLVAQGWEIGSHTATHPLLTRVADERLRDELIESRTAIETRLGSCSSLAYPYGIADDRVAAAARDCGFEAACTLTFAHVVDEPLRRPRIGLGTRDTGLRLRLHVSQLGRAARRSSAVRAARSLRRRRPWLPDK